jgi:hypothetical protein
VTQPITEAELAQFRELFHAPGRVSWRGLVYVLKDHNRILDLILDDGFPTELVVDPSTTIELRREVNEVVQRQEVVARAHYRLARALEWQQQPTRRFPRVELQDAAPHP